MKKGFAHKLLLYILSVLIITFCLICAVIFTSSQQFLYNNAYNEANTIAINTIITLEYKISELENIPQTIYKVFGDVNTENHPQLPAKILQRFPLLSACSINNHSGHPGDLPYIQARRINRDSIANFTGPASGQTQSVIRKNKRNGYWLEDKANQEDLIYCEPIANERSGFNGTLKLNCNKDILTNFIHTFKLIKTGYLYIIDDKGNFIDHPFLKTLKHNNLYNYTKDKDIDYSRVIDKFVKGETGADKVFKNNKQYYLYYTPIPQMNWRLGIICPYQEIFLSANKFYILLFICFSLGLAFLIWYIIRITHQLASPLKNFALTVRKIADGQFDIRLPEYTSTSEIKELYDSFKYMQENIIDNIKKLQENAIETERINSEMNLARKIQKKLLAKEIELPANIGLHAELHQSREVGGDMYEYFIIDNKLYFAIGDVSGKSIPAALYMASSIPLLRCAASKTSSTSEICKVINKYMCASSDDDMYVTLFLGVMDINTGIITYTNAGHPYPIIVHQNGQVSFLSKYPNIPIGILEDFEYEEHTYILHKGCQLLLYTDGVTDSENSQAKFYGKERLVECIKGTSVKEPEVLVTAILQDIKNHTGQSSQTDDLTIFSILYKSLPGVSPKHMS